MARRSPRDLFRAFIALESAGGLVLMGSAALALIVANSPLAPVYFETLKAHFLGLSLLHWVNDALMSLFFLLVGLEIKRELLAGRLASWKDRALPGLAALGGMIVPALIYVAFNMGDPAAVRGWAIPSATDIAFSLGVLSLLGSRVPLSLKVFLTALAILDDLGAVVIIAVFYTADLHPTMIGLAALTTAALAALKPFKLDRLPIYLALGALLWVFVFLSGVHATIAGVVLAATIPIRRADGRMDGAPLTVLEHKLSRFVPFIVLPVFGFANAGVSLAGLGLAALAHPVTLGSALGLFIGKQIGVLGGAWLAIQARVAAPPAGATGLQLYGVAILCGIGFTMSLFIGLLAFTSDTFHDATKIGVLLGSLLSAVVGYGLLRIAAPARDS